MRNRSLEEMGSMEELLKDAPPAEPGDDGRD